MGRVNLEEQFFSQSRKRRLARNLGYPEHMIVGLLASLWHDSQDYEQTTASAKEICEWARLDELQDWEFGRDKVTTTDAIFIEAMITSRFLTEVEPGKYRIHGNEAQLEQIKKWKDRAHKAAEARWGKHVKVDEPRKKEETCISNAQACSEAMPSNTIQFNTIHNNSLEKEVSTERSLSEPSGAPIEFYDPVIQEFFSRAKVKTSTQMLWLKTYGDSDWLKQEFLKVITWLDANPAKRPKKNYARFIGGWLSRGWEWHRKTIQSQPAGQKSVLEELQGLGVSDDTTSVCGANGAP